MVAFSLLWIEGVSIFVAFCKKKLQNAFESVKGRAMKSFLRFENGHNPALFFQDHRPADGTSQFNAYPILLISK